MGTTINNKKLTCRSVIIEVGAQDANALRPLLRENWPAKAKADGTPNEEYTEELRLKYPLTRNWTMVPFSLNRDVPVEVLKQFYRDQNTWDKECFCIPRAGIEGASRIRC